MVICVGISYKTENKCSLDNIVAIILFSIVYLVGTQQILDQLNWEIASLQTRFISRAQIQQTMERMTIYWDDNRDLDWSDWPVYLSGADIQLVVWRKLTNLFWSYLSSKHAISSITC